VPFAAGGGTDAAARLVAMPLGEALGQPVVVENRPGAGGTTGSDLVAKAAPDGYTLVLGTNATHAAAPGLYRDRLTYDPVQDFTAIGPVAEAPSVLVVHPSLPVASVPELIAYLRARSGAVAYGSAGSGSPAHLSAQLFQRLTGTVLLHVPYRGGAPAVTDLVAGRLGLMFAGPVETLPQVRAGALRALAVTTGERFPGLPDLPTVAEAGMPGYALAQWFGLFGPTGLPAAVTAKLAEALRQAVASPAAAERLATLGMAPVQATDPAAYAAFVGRERDTWSRLAVEAGAQVD
jgi:tripartite-type tricarboxylate transporter receptor subunit TctC